MNNNSLVGRGLRVAVVFAMAALLLGGCDDLFGNNDKNTAPSPVEPAPTLPQDGTMTVFFSGTYSGTDEYLWCRLYQYEEWNMDHPPAVLAAGSALITSNTTFTLRTANESFGYTDTVWTGTGGAQYDMYVQTGDVNGTPSAEATERFGYYPVRPFINGNTTQEVDHLVGYSTGSGQLTVTLSGAAVHSGKPFGVGVFGTFGDEGPGDEVMIEAAAIGADGTAEIAFGAFSPPWDSRYYVVLSIFLEGNPETDPIAGDGDLIYKITPIPWHVNGGRHMRPAYADFRLFEGGS
ncbi:MAG: hypothetical protein EA427_06020 [Spirochaetaceae bacterium]|nr:MAG: hypothetical protein EA427_06020 [Spirochaetaceae bacterium]